MHHGSVSLSVCEKNVWKLIHISKTFWPRVTKFYTQSDFPQKKPLNKRKECHPVLFLRILVGTSAIQTRLLSPPVLIYGVLLGAVSKVQWGQQKEIHDHYLVDRPPLKGYRQFVETSLLTPLPPLQWISFCWPLQDPAYVIASSYLACMESTTQRFLNMCS